MESLEHIALKFTQLCRILCFIPSKFGLMGLEQFFSSNAFVHWNGPPLQSSESIGFRLWRELSRETNGTFSPVGTKHMEKIIGCVRKLVKFIKKLRVYRAKLLWGSCAIVQLLELDVSVLGLPSHLLRCRLSVLCCLDVVPLGLLVVRQQQLLGQALKERKLVNLVQFGNLNKFRVKINGQLLKELTE